MGWIRYPIALDDHRALFTFSRHDCINTFGTLSRFDQIIQAAEANPEELEDAIRYLIEDTRPDLIDCTIEWMNYSYQMNCLKTRDPHVAMSVVSQYWPGVPLRAEKAGEWFDVTEDMTMAVMGFEAGNLAMKLFGIDPKLIKDITFSFPLKGEATVTIVRQLSKEEVEHAREIIAATSDRKVSV